MKSKFLISFALLLLFTILFTGCGRDERDTNKRLVKLGHELVEYGKTHPRHYQTFAPEGLFPPRAWGLWELSKFGDPDSIYVLEPPFFTERSIADYHLVLHKEEYDLSFKIFYSSKNDGYSVDGFICNQIGSKHSDYMSNMFQFERENKGTSGMICEDGVLGYVIGKTSKKEIYTKSYDEDFYKMIGLSFKFENDTLTEVLVEHDNQMKTEKEVGFFYYFYDIKKIYGEPESEGIDISHWYPSLGFVDSYNYGNLSFVSNHSHLMLIIIRKPEKQA